MKGINDVLGEEGELEIGLSQPWQKDLENELLARFKNLQICRMATRYRCDALGETHFICILYNE